MSALPAYHAELATNNFEKDLQSFDLAAAIAAVEKDLTQVVLEYRKRGLPLDNIVQDWFYWPEDQWGCQCVDTKRYPDAKGMVDQFHANNVHAMISVWAAFRASSALRARSRQDGSCSPPVPGATSQNTPKPTTSSTP